jgi:NOL1/NOP2/fmu family ribosome biogenesis protein
VIDPCPDDVRTRVVDYLEERFGLDPKVLSGYSFWVSAKGRVIIGPATIPAGISIDTAGILIARALNNVKPSSNLLQLFGRQMSRGIVSLQRDEARTFMQGLDMALPSYAEVDFSDGYVVMQYEGYPLGCALLKEGKIKNMLPRAKRLNVEFY